MLMLLQTQISGYESSFSVKTVILYNYPYATNGLSVPTGVILDANSYLTFAPAMAASTSFLIPNVQIPAAAVYAYPTTIANPVQATAAMYVTINGVQYVIAAFIKYPDGRNRLEFYID